MKEFTNILILFLMMYLHHRFELRSELEKQKITINEKNQKTLMDYNKKVNILFNKQMKRCRQIRSPTINI